MKHIPKWFPGAGFKKKAEYYGSMVRKMVSTPFEEARESVVSGPKRIVDSGLLFNARIFEQTMGKANNSFAGINIKRILDGSNVYDEFLIKNTATAIYGGEHILLIYLFPH